MTDVAAHALTVLVVDDDKDVADTTADLLRTCGFHARVARDGEEAIRAAATAPPDAVLMDIGMPGMDGWELARRLREQAVTKRPLMVAVSGRGEPADKARSEAAGIDLHLVKPADPQLLIGMLERFQRLLCTKCKPLPAGEQ